MTMRKTALATALAAFALTAAVPALAADTLKLAIGQRGLWDSSFAEVGQKLGIWKKHDLDVEVFYTRAAARRCRW